MKLTQIDILKYKSIKQPLYVKFNEGNVITLIGKNGSGKTNVLEAIKFSLSKNRYYRQEKIECKIKYHIELSDNEIDEYFSCVHSDEKSKEIVVAFNSDNPELRLIESPIICIEAKNLKSRLEDILENYKKATHNYLKALKRIESSESYFGRYLDVLVKEDNPGSFAYMMDHYHIERIEENLNRQIREIKKYIEHIFKGNKIYINQHSVSYSLSQYLNAISFLRIPEDNRIEISPIIAQSLNISKKALEKANEKLNNKLKEINIVLETEYKAIQNQLDEFDKIKQEIANIFDAKLEEQYEQKEQFDNLLESIIQKLRKAVFRNCYYIDNENSLIFYNSPDYAYRNDPLRHDYLNSRNPIVDAFDTFLHEKNIIDESISIAQKDKWDQDQISKSIRALNSKFLRNLIPKFDNNEIKKFEVKYNDGFALYVHEKNGDKVSFNNTSLGRRWYLTYQFVKALLQPGDMLLIDEPAAFLHPQAQTEFKKELEMLAHQGICVFYSTHSPYMIPEDWRQVYNITMTDKGTQATTFETDDDLCQAIISELGARNTNDILFNLSKTIILVEGIADKTCLERFAELLNYDLSKYHIHICDGDAILQVAYICLKHKFIKVKVVLDNDNKYKNEYYRRTHSMYRQCIDLLNDHPNCHIYIGEGKNGCLEDLFVEENNKKYMHYDTKKQKWKVDINSVNRIKSINEVSDYTKTNFEQLFAKLFDGSKH